MKIPKVKLVNREWINNKYNNHEKEYIGAIFLGQPLLRATLNGQKKGAAEAAPLSLASKLSQLGFECVVAGHPASMIEHPKELQFLLLAFQLLFEVADSVEHLSPLHFELNVFERLECGE
jgi:hypothetical protein